MGTENRALVGDALELVVAGLGPYLDARSGAHGTEAKSGVGAEGDRDLLSMLGVLIEEQDPSLDGGSGDALAAYAREMRTVWDAWSRIRAFDAAETYRALDTAARLLQAADAEDEAATIRDLATFPLAVFAARVLAEYVVDERADPETSGSGEASLPSDERLPSDEPPIGEDTPRGDDVRRSEDDAGDEPTRPVRLRAVNHSRRAERVEDARAPASIRALRAVDPALPLVTWAELSDTITALLATGRLDPQVLAGFTRRSLSERARAAVDGATGRGVTIRFEHVTWVVSVLRARYTGTARITRAAATALVAEYIAELAPRAGVDPRRVRQDMMAWVDVERA